MDRERDRYHDRDEEYYHRRNSRHDDADWRKRDRDDNIDKKHHRRSDDYNRSSTKRGRYRDEGSRHQNDRHQGLSHVNDSRDEHTHFHAVDNRKNIDQSMRKSSGGQDSSQSSDSNKRSGIGLNTDEWEAPQRLSSQKSRDVRGGDTSDCEWSKPTPLPNQRSGGQSSHLTVSSAGHAEIKSDVESSQRLPSGYSEYDMNDDEFTASKSRMRYGDDESDEEFDRDFYLADEGQTMITAGDSTGNVDSFLGSSSKFKQREAEMAKRRALGDTKMAGMSARKSQLHADQEAWEDSRLLLSGVATNREVMMQTLSCQNVVLIVLILYRFKRNLTVKKTRELILSCII